MVWQLGRKPGLGMWVGGGEKENEEPRPSSDFGMRE